MASSTRLDGTWRLRLLPPDPRLNSPDMDAPAVPAHLRAALDAGVPAEVPGSVHAMLLANGLIDDPLAADHETAARWVGWQRWELSRDVTLEQPADHHELVFDGIDTVAEVRWDDEPLGRTRNMHRRHRFAVASGAEPGSTHRLSVVFEANEVEALAAQERLGGPMPNSYDRPFNALRTVACTFGWDWGPDLVSAGLWRSVRLEAWSGARLGDVGVRTEREGDGWLVTTTVTVDADAPVGVRVRLLGTEAEALASSSGDVTLTQRVTGEAWWPRTHGVPHLYDHTIDVVDDAGQVVDGRTVRTGLREIALDRSPDEIGSAFTLRVNGEPVFVRGVNWIPDHAFPGATTHADIAARLADAAEAGCNLVRVWGGGTYESEDFYDLTDELGLLVWQDFAFACAAYSEEPELADEVAAEAADALARLRRRPSLALWCGNNENIWAHETWEGWPEQIGDRGWGLGYYLDLLPRLCAELDPDRPYVPGTPSSGEGLPANDDNHGCQHLWDVWNELDHEHYLDHTPRFVAEFGYQGPPAWTTMADAVGSAHMVPGDPVFEAHQKAEGGEDKLARGLASHGGATTDAETWWWRTQLVQAQALRLGVTHLRSLAPVCSGSVWWQLNDCWPVISWSVVDAAGRRKPAWFALRAAHADRVVALLGVRTPQLRLVNDTDADWDAEVLVTAVSVDDGRVATQTLSLSVPARSAAVSDVDLGDVVGSDTVLVADADGHRSAPWLPRGLDARLPEPSFSVAAHATADGWELAVSADTLVTDLTWWVDRLDPDATVDRGLLTLLPGETATVRVGGCPDADPADFGSPAVCWHAAR